MPSTTRCGRWAPSRSSRCRSRPGGFCRRSGGSSTAERKRGTHFSLAADPSSLSKGVQGRWSQNFRWPVLGIPGINDRHAEIVEMPHVASCERSALRQGNAGDHGIAEIARPASATTRIHKECRLFCGSVVEGKDAALELFLNNALEQRVSLCLPASGRHRGQTVTDFKDRHSCRPHRRPCLTIKPCSDDYFVFAKHQRRKYIGIENDHSSNFAGLTG